MSVPPGNVAAPMLTSITVNGPEGLRFLASLHAQRTRPVPPALAAMIEHVLSSPTDLDSVRLEVSGSLADEIAGIVDDLAGGGQPLLFSAEIGDLVLIVRDVLVEVQIGKREARTWRYIPGGTRGRLVGRRGDLGKIQLLDGPRERDIAFVSDRCTTRSRPIRRVASPIP